MIDVSLQRAYLLAQLGTVYRFGTSPGGGDDPVLGYDCSGLACEWLRANGLVSWNFRTNAQGLYDLSKIKAWTWKGLQAEFGALAFYGADFNRIVHVGICWDAHSMIEAGGGDSTTDSVEVASAKNAFVRVRPIQYRKDFLALTKPIYSSGVPL